MGEGAMIAITVDLVCYQLMSCTLGHRRYRSSLIRLDLIYNKTQNASFRIAQNMYKNNLNGGNIGRASRSVM